MERKKRFDAKKHSIRIALVALTIAAGLALTGCGKRFARMEENQIKLLRLSETNAKQVARSLARLEENQKKSRVAIADVQAGTKTTVTNIAAVEQNQQGLKGGIERMQSGVQKVASGTDALLQNMLQLLEVVQNNSQNLANTMNVVGQKQLKFDEKILGNIQAIAAAVNAIEQQQGKMQGQIGDVQNNAQGMRKEMIAVLERLRAELSKISAQVGSAGAVKDEPSPAEPEE